ncbi:lipase 3-like [Prorops nasuta]|uniref:lipase 3-like n=1 Tax=Prorops nasuta TaxID=863751 RepID=UPI0034CF36E0
MYAAPEPPATPIYKAYDLTSRVYFAKDVMAYRGLPLVLQWSALIISSCSAITRPDENPDIHLKTPDLVRKYGYTLEVHEVTTEDGYNLQLHRIPYGRRNSYDVLGSRSISGSRHPILLQHGLAGSSADWVLMGPGRSLAYLLADQGYDVWLGNNRGNIYSANHSHLATTDRAFWNFSFHELGVYDLPAMIEYILEETGREKIIYTGHSQGATQFYVMCSEIPDYNSKITLMIGLAPAAFTGNIRGPVTTLAKLTYFGVWVGETFGYPEFGKRSAWGKIVSNLFCQSAAPTQFVCSNILFSIAGFSHDELDRDNLTVIIGHVPAGASWKQLVHFGQGYINPDHFRQFDYGQPRRNLKAYNSFIPPEYQLNKIVAPVALFSSENDPLATTKDVEILKSKLANVILDYQVPTKTFNHYDFLWGKTSTEMVFVPMLQLLAQYG